MLGFNIRATIERYPRTMEGEPTYQILKSPFERQKLYDNGGDMPWTETRARYSVVAAESSEKQDYEEVIHTSKACQDTGLSMADVAKGIGIVARHVDRKDDTIAERGNLTGKCIIEYPQEDGEVGFSSSLAITYESDGMTLYTLTKNNDEVRATGRKKISRHRMDKINLPIPEGAQVAYGVRSRIKMVGNDSLTQDDPSPEIEKMTEVRHAIIDYKK